eukprot:1949249-Rhodomonas_salina.4
MERVLGPIISVVPDSAKESTRSSRQYRTVHKRILYAASRSVQGIAEEGTRTYQGGVPLQLEASALKLA